jgi:hypothetical protein
MGFAKEMVAYTRSLTPAAGYSRLVDTNSGGAGNNLHIGDVDDIHDYPYPADPKVGCVILLESGLIFLSYYPQASATQYAMVGEFGGIGAFIADKEWVPGKCHTYLKVDTAAAEAR